MTGESQFYCFRNGSLDEVREPDNCEIKIAAADSWLVEDGRVRSLDRHFARFTSAIEKVSPSHLSYLDGFFSAVVAALPRTGRWFPRIEFHADDNSAQHLHLRLRVAPELLDTVTLWTLDEPDPRVSPSIKGPDLSLGQQLRRRANLHGAEEAALLNREGIVLEGALSSLVWWRDGVLCAPPESVPWLPSVTREVIFEIARQSGYQTREELVTPERLNGLEIWALSSLHGIRLVTAWDALPDGPAAGEHVDAFNRRLRMMLTALEQREQ
jgi:hypothetical protein